MKYTIELTNKEKHRFEYMCKRAAEWGLGFIPVLEPMGVMYSEEDMNSLLESINHIQYDQGVEDGKKQGYAKGKADGYKLGVADGKSIMQTVPEDLLNKERQDGYNQGFEDGKNEAIYNTELIPELKKCNYTLGYNQALDDASDLIAFFGYNFMHECYPEECEIFYSLYDLNAKYGLAEILEKWKAYTKQQKEVENYHKLVDTLRTITDEYPRETIINALSEFGIEVNESEGVNDN